jgi:SNF2 family DNA or RNA helicase
MSRNCLEVQCDRNDLDTQAKLTGIFPVHANRIKTSYKMSIHKVPEVLQLLRGIGVDNIDTAPPQVQEYFYREMAIRNNVTDLIANGPRNSPKVNEHLTLMRHQQLGREIAKYQDRYAFFYDTRTGKTPLSLSIMYDDIVANPSHKWLVVCPLILIDNAWIPDAAQFVPELTTISCHATTPAKRLQRLATPANIYVTNTESFVKYREHFDKMGFEGCIVDESSDMKSPSSKVSKELVDFAQTVKRFYILSGTPAPNGEHEYYMQLKSVDFYSVQSSYTQFKEYFFVNMSYNPQYEKLALRPDRKDELFSLIRKYALYVDKEDVLTTPGRTFHEVEFELPVDLKKHYNKLKNELYMELGDGVRITAPSAAAKLNKLNQVTSGFIIDTQAVKENKFYEDSNLQEWYLLDKYRFDRLALLLENECRGEQVLIWANYRKEFELISEMLGDRCRCVYGGTSIQDKNDAIQRFKDGRIQYLIANPASADKGLTLTNAHISIYFSLNWSYELFKQSMERIYGDIRKQPKHCDYYVMIAKGTIDRVLYSDVLQGKGTASYAVLNHLKGGNI